MNRQFAYPKHFTYIIDFPRVTSITLLFSSIYLHIFHPITILTILRLPVLCINQCPRHMFVSFCFSISLLLSKQESFPKQIQDRSAGGPHIPRFVKFWGVVFVNFDSLTRIYFDFSQHAMFTICILFTTLLQKLRVCVKGH